ncbi:hypothetical protein BD769DRAFT_1665265 [Suillus cothurnatus]|nr:hypothetical protein BD769DRAFT_1665265 [Suillus cothurnatus]
MLHHYWNLRDSLAQQTILLFQEEQRRAWHSTITSAKGAWDISIIDEIALTWTFDQVYRASLVQQDHGKHESHDTRGDPLPHKLRDALLPQEPQKSLLTHAVPVGQINRWFFRTAYMALVPQLCALSAWGHMVTASSNVQWNVCGTTISPPLQCIPTNLSFCAVPTNPSASIGNVQEAAPVVIMTNATYVQDALPPLMEPKTALELRRH